MKTTEIMQRLGQGSVAEEFEDKLRIAAQEAIAHDGKASVTITVNMKPNGDDGVEIESVVKMTTPIQKHAKNFLFVTEDGLTVNDPKQLSMERELDRR